VLIILALAAGGLFTRYLPDVDVQQQPFVRGGNVGTTVDLRTFDADVLSVRGATVISDADHTHDTSGVWILVRIRLQAVHKTVTVGYAVLRDAQGRTYAATTRIQQNLVPSVRALQPGVPVVGEVAFEVPVAVATHLSIRLAAAPFDTRMDDMANVPLPISDGMVRQWKAQTAPMSLADPTVVK
jgi:hypothetical protein